MPLTGVRCLAHPSRPAVDRCPVCDRPRCGADARGVGCALCKGRPAARPARPPSPLELCVRAALGVYGAALVSSLVLQEYVDAPFFGYIAPAMAGVACGSAATAAAGEPRGALLARIRLIGAVGSLLAVGLGFMLDQTYGALDLEVAVVVPYLVAGVAAWLWTGPPQRRKVRASPPG